MKAVSDILVTAIMSDSSSHTMTRTLVNKGKSNPTYLQKEQSTHILIKTHNVTVWICAKRTQPPHIHLSYLVRLFIHPVYKDQNLVVHNSVGRLQ